MLVVGVVPFGDGTVGYGAIDDGSGSEGGVGNGTASAHADVLPYYINTCYINNETVPLCCEPSHRRTVPLCSSVFNGTAVPYR